MKINHLPVIAVGSLLFCLPVVADAQVSRQKVVWVKIRREQGTTQPITLKSTTPPNYNTNTPAQKSNWVLEIKAKSSLLVLGATVNVSVRQLGDPNNLAHKVAITLVNSNSIVFGPDVQGISTASVTVPIEALGANVGGVFSVDLQAEAILTEAGTAKVTKSSVSGTYNFLFPETFNIVGGGQPEPFIQASPSVRPNMNAPSLRSTWDSAPRLRSYMENYYDWLVGHERTQRSLNAGDDDN